MARPSNGFQPVAQNRRARFDYEILETLEAGIMLTGSEVKSVRSGKVSINESYAGEMGGDMAGEIYLFNANITEYTEANQFNHQPTRPRKLLLRKRQANRFLGSIRRKGMTLIPLTLYFNAKGLAKIELGLGKGKKTVDKRQTIKEREWGRDKARLLRNNNKGD